MDGRRESNQTRDRGQPRGRGPFCGQQRRPRRDRHAQLSRDEIVRAAIDIADAEGADAISMRRIAQHLHAGAMSLYWHVSSKEELINLVLDEIFGEITLPSKPTGDWRADLRLVCTESRRVLLQHPWAQSLFSLQQGDSPNSLRNIEFALAAMDGLALDTQTKFGIYLSLHVFVEGFVLHEVVFAEMLREQDLTAADWRKAMEPIQRQITEIGEYQHLAQALENFPTFDSSKHFEFGLDSLLDGIAARIGDEQR